MWWCLSVRWPVPALSPPGASSERGNTTSKLPSRAMESPSVSSISWVGYTTEVMQTLTPNALVMFWLFTAGIAHADGGDASAETGGSDTGNTEVKADSLVASAQGVSAASKPAVEHQEVTLDNGLRVIAMRDPTPGLVAVQTWISVGSGDEVTPGSSGYAHFFEHLMFHGTPTWSGPAREARLVALGVEENAWTSQDETC